MNFQKFRYSRVISHIACTVLMCGVCCALSVRAEKDVLRPAMNTTPPADSWVMFGSMGIRRERFPSLERVDNTRRSIQTGKLEDSTNASYGIFLPSLQKAFTDRLHISFIAPGLAYRIGERGDVETVPFLQVSPSVGYSNDTHGTFSMMPWVGVSERRWLNSRTAIQWTLATGSYFQYIGRNDCSDDCPDSVYFERGTIVLNVGWVHDVNRFVSIAPSVLFSLPWNRSSSPNEIGPSVVRLLGSSSNGLWYQPLVRFHMSDYVGLGFSVGCYFNTGTFAYGWDSQLDVLVMW